LGSGLGIVRADRHRFFLYHAYVNRPPAHAVRRVKSRGGVGTSYVARGETSGASRQRAGPTSLRRRRTNCKASQARELQTCVALCLTLWEPWTQ
jgi:hypothetical protein